MVTVPLFSLTDRKLEALQARVSDAFSPPQPRRGGRVVYGTRFEIGRGVKLTVGSNPTLSAIFHKGLSDFRPGAKPNRNKGLLPLPCPYSRGFRATTPCARKAAEAGPGPPRYRWKNRSRPTGRKKPEKKPGRTRPGSFRRF